MSGGYWSALADDALAPVFAALPDDADPATIKAACREAYPFGERAYHPYKVWGQRVKAWTETRARWIAAGGDPARLDLRPLAMRAPASGDTKGGTDGG